MTPDFSVLAAGVDIARQIKDRLVSLTVADEAGVKSDTVEIVLDDRDGLIEQPLPGAPLVVAMGYRETFLIPLGAYTFDEWSPSGFPRTVTLRGKAANLGGSIKEQNTRARDKKTLKEIVTKIAGDHSLKYKVAAPLAKIKYDHLDQTEESDIHFLNRIGRDHDAMATVKAGTLIMMARGQGLIVSGLAMLPRPIDPTTVLSYSGTFSTRDLWKTVEAQWHDRKTGRREIAKAGGGGPVRRLRHLHTTKDEAENAALWKMERSNNTLSMTAIGDATIAAEGRVLVLGLRNGVDGLWSIKSVQHSISGSGFTTSIEAELPG
jgi:phage protein D